MAAPQELDTLVEHRMHLTRLLEVRDDLQARVDSELDNLRGLHIEALRLLTEVDKQIALFERGGIFPFQQGKRIARVWHETTLQDVVLDAQTAQRPKWRRPIHPS